MDKCEFLVLRQEDSIAWLTLNRPDAMNALHPGVMRELETVARAFIEDVETRVVVFCGAGKHFSAGADLRYATDGPAPGLLAQRRNTELGGRMLRAIREIPQVTIAAVHGAALGGGACIPVACDFRIGSSDCVLGYPEINLGMNLMWGALPQLVHLVGPARAKRMLMSGERVEADRLLEWGLLDALVDQASLYDSAREWALRYAAEAPMAVQMIKRSVNMVASALDQAIMHMDADQNLLTSFSRDRKEALEAWLARRPASFSGN